MTFDNSHVIMTSRDRNFDLLEIDIIEEKS